jgi:hypothetical protein
MREIQMLLHPPKDSQAELHQQHLLRPHRLVQQQALQQH